MATKRIIGRLYALPTALEFEIHQDGGEVIHGRIDSNIASECLKRFNGTGEQCRFIVQEYPTTLLSIESA